jgi:hypothetical protein
MGNGRTTSMEGYSVSAMGITTVGADFANLIWPTCARLIWPTFAH